MIGVKNKIIVTCDHNSALLLFIPLNQVHQSKCNYNSNYRYLLIFAWKQEASFFFNARSFIAQNISNTNCVKNNRHW